MRVTGAFPTAMRFTGALVVLGLLASVAAAPPASAVTRPASPRSVTQDNGSVAGISADSATDAWAVGGSRLTLHWNGTSWSRVTPPKPQGRSGLLAVTAISPSDAWAVGQVAGSQPDTGSAWILHWDGTTWAQVTSPMPSGADDAYLDGVAAVSASDIWAVGSSTNSKGNFKPLALHWNGTSWAIVPTPALFLGSLNAVTAVSTSDVWAVGTYGTNPEKALVLRWNGTSWSQVATPPTGSFADLNGVSADSATDAWAVGWYGDPSKNLLLHWNGTSWSQVTAPDLGPDNGLDGVSALSTGDAWAVGSYDNSTVTKVFTLALHWNGTSWTKTSTPNPGTASGLSAVSAISADDVLAAGSTSPNSSGLPSTTLLLGWNGKSWTRT
jgi:hypothetical protein